MAMSVVWRNFLFVFRVRKIILVHRVTVSADGFLAMRASAEQRNDIGVSGSLEGYSWSHRNIRTDQVMIVFWG